MQDETTTGGQSARAEQGSDVFQGWTDRLAGRLSEDAREFRRLLRESADAVRRGLELVAHMRCLNEWLRTPGEAECLAGCGVRGRRLAGMAVLVEPEGVGAPVGCCRECLTRAQRQGWVVVDMNGDGRA